MPSILTQQKPGGAAPATGAPGAGAGAAAVRANRFLNATHQHTEPIFDSSYTLSASIQQIAPIDVPAYGYLRALHVFVQVTAAGNSANVALREDAPWNVLQDLSLVDANGAPIIGPLSGFDLYLINLFGAINAFDADPVRSAAYTAPVTGTGATGGTFAFMLTIPLEIVARDGFGCLPNASAGSPFRVRMSLNNLTGIYSTSPTAAPTARVRAWLDSYMIPSDFDARGVPNEKTPPQLGTAQFWRKQTTSIVSGSNTVRVGLTGNLFRNLILINRDTTPARSTTNLPDPLTMAVDGLTVLTHGRDLFRHFMTQKYGYPATASAGVSSGLPTGVVALPFCDEFGGKPGYELRDSYWPTNTATRFEFSGSWGAAGSLDILVNDVVPAAMP